MNRIHKAAVISKLTDIEKSVRGNFVDVEENVSIDSFVKIKFAGGNGNIFIKSGVVINSGSVIYSGKGLIIDQNSIIGANVVISPVSHQYQQKDIPIKSQGFESDIAFKDFDCSVYIGKDVWIGPNSVVLDRSYIPDGCVISAGSVVFGVLQPNGIYVGSPIKLIGFRS